LPQLAHLTKVLKLAEKVCVCVPCSTDLELQLGCMLLRELSRYFEKNKPMAQMILKAF
jgi:hypothetical protein